MPNLDLMLKILEPMASKGFKINQELFDELTLVILKIELFNQEQPTDGEGSKK